MAFWRRKARKTAKEKLQSLWALGGLTPRQLARRVYDEFWNRNLLDRAAVLGFYFMLALFPALIFLATLLGLMAEPGSVVRDGLFRYIANVLPGDAAVLVSDILDEVARAAGGFKLTFGVAITLWFATNGTNALIYGLDSAYDIVDSRPWYKVRALALVMTVGFSALIIGALALVLFGGEIVEGFGSLFGVGPFALSLWKLLQWPLAIGFMVLTFALLYYYGPDVAEQKWYWITPGSVFGVTLWLATSYLFRIYLQYFNTYSLTYGSLGAAMILMLWLYITGLALLVGAEINAEIEQAAAHHGDPEAKAEGEKRPAA